MFRDRLQDAQARIGAALDTTIGQSIPAGTLQDAMRHACTGGKRLRGFLVLESAALHDVAAEAALQAAQAVEMVHAYSLVHDDLPCMDDDDLRRGQPTVHVRWDEATAVLVGDALQALAFQTLTLPVTGPEQQRLALIFTLAGAGGGQGMVLGQAQDIAAETAAVPLTLDQVMELQKNKTGALIEWSAMAGAILGRADPAPMGRFGQAIGLAFQIADDILDVEGDSVEAGKRVGKDAEAGKATFVSLMGLEGARRIATDLVEEAIEVLSPFGTEAEALRGLARYVIDRKT